jgi:uncharacterized protein (DUF1330 family)
VCRIGSAERTAGKAMTANVAAHQGRFLVRGGRPERMEDDGVLPDTALFQEFPGREHARAFWQWAAFRELAMLRWSGSVLKAILVDALA